jgi:hypothetical protein
MRIRTPADLGAFIRDSRTKLRLDQESLADKVGVSLKLPKNVSKWQKTRSDYMQRSNGVGMKCFSGAPHQQFPGVHRNIHTQKDSFLPTIRLGYPRDDCGNLDAAAGSLCLDSTWTSPFRALLWKHRRMVDLPGRALACSLVGEKSSFSKARPARLVPGS